MDSLIVIMVYGGIFVFLAWLAIAFYLRSVTTRKVYQCPGCGESFRVELMEADHCNVCGTALAQEGR